MPHSLDNLLAVVVGTVIILLLAALYVRTQGENLDALRNETNRTRMLDLVQTLERDLRNAGSGTDQSGVISWSDAAPTGDGMPVTRLEFYTTVDTSATARPWRIRYDLAAVDSARVNGVWAPLYELRRHGYDGTGYTLLSASTRTITEFDIRLLNASGTLTTQPADARAFVVRAVTLSPLGADGVTKDSRWETIMWPVNLGS
jgi:hypothetical protein